MNEIDVYVERDPEISVTIAEDERKTQTKSTTPTKAAQTVTPDAGYLLDAVNVAAIPDEYIIPDGTVEITQNGDTDVTEFATARVAVPLPAGKITLTENATGVDIAQYAEADVAVPPPVLQTKTVTPTEQQHIVEADSGYDALSQVTVERIPQEYIVPQGSVALRQDGIYNVSQYAEAVVNTAPEKGFVFSDYDSDGYPLTITIIGFNPIPDRLLLTSTKILNKIENVFFNNCGTTTTDYCCALSTIKHVEFGIGITMFTSYSVRYSSVETVICHDNIKVWQYIFYNVSTLKNFIFKKSITAWHESVFAASTSKPELYDFSHCESVFALPNSSTTCFARADGCVIKIPYALSDENLGVGNGWQITPVCC